MESQLKLPRSLPISIVVIFAIALSACASVPQRTVTSPLEQGKLKPCPRAPHCVSSDVYASEQKTPAYIEPFEIAVLPHTAWETARNIIAATKKTRIAAQRAGYLHAEVASPWNVYTDDLELRLDQGQRFIHVRSSSRIGYYDFGVNRERVERLRSELLARGVIKRAGS